MRVTNDITHPDVGALYKCKCGRKILVESVLVGVNHTARMFVVCWECLDKKTKKRAIRQYKLEGAD